MIPQEIHRLYNILASFLGESKKELDETYQLQFPCPRCIEENGSCEAHKYNLEVSLSKQIFNCWKCSSVHDEMHGSILKLIKLYGNEKLLKEYKETIYSLRQTKLYEMKFTKNEFNIDYDIVEKDEVKLPINYVKFEKDKYFPKKAMDYLNNRNINWDIINKFDIGFTTYDENNKQVSNRIIIPSYNKYGELNYWTGRDFTNLKYRQKYFNPNVERKDVIFNEEKIQWDCDVTLVEGPFDHIVVPNSIPLLGKSLKTDFKLFEEIYKNAKANINIFLDADAYNDILKIYRLLNHDRLYNKIRYIPSDNDLDPSKIYELYGKKGIIEYLKRASKISEIML